MGKKVVLTITGVQHMDGEDKTIELVTTGHFSREGSIYYIEYEDSILTGFEGNKTLITIDGDKISLERTGQFNTQLMFEKGKKYVNCYDTPYGVHEMGIYPTSIELDLGLTKGKLDLKYQLDISGEYVGANELSLSYDTKMKNSDMFNKTQRS